jgi:sugar transferase (PEP-CTERM system associated)
MPVIRIFKHYLPTAFLLLALVEYGVFVLGFHIGVIMRFGGDVFTEDVLPGLALHKALAYATIMHLCMVGMHLYERGVRQEREAIVVRLAGAFLLGIVPLSVLYYFMPTLFLGRGALAFAHLAAFGGILFMRFAFYQFVNREVIKRRILVLGTGKRAAAVRSLRRRNDIAGGLVIGYVKMPGEEACAEPCIESSDSENIAALARRLNADELVLAVDDRRNSLPVGDLLDCKMSGIAVTDLLSFFERETGQVRLDFLEPSWLYLSDGFGRSLLRSWGKRVFDIVAALIMLPFTLPLMALAALAIRLESGGPVLFHQPRVGVDGRVFTLHKFRSMRTDAEEDGEARWAEHNDPRVTLVGRVLRKVRLDELPQLWNILAGHMSLVGPRPERPEFVAGLAASIPYYNERHRVKPGLTGWAQIRYQYANTHEDSYRKLQYDLYYVKNYSLFIDLLILIQTAEVVMLGKGAH